MLKTQRVLAWIFALSPIWSFIIGLGAALLFAKSGIPRQDGAEILMAIQGVMGILMFLLIIAFIVVNILVFGRYQFLPKYKLVPADGTA